MDPGADSDPNAQLPDQRPTVLVVDDESQHRQIAEYVLRTDYNVLTAKDAEEALAVTEHRPVDLVLADYRMPGTNGTALLARLREIHPDCIRFLVTAYSDETVLKEAINDAGVYRFVSKPVNFVNLEMDIRRALEHRMAQQQVAKTEKLAMAGALASIAVHDLRNSVQGLMLVPMWIESGAAEDLQRAKKTLQWAQKTMMNCISEVLTVAKGGQPEYELNVGPIDDIVRNTVNLQSHLFRDRHFGVEVSSAVPPIRRSEKHIQRMIANLVNNGAQATAPGGHVDVRVFTEAGQLVVEVADTGTGIPPELQPRIFEPLFTTKGGAGVGLGLKLCQSVMQAHGGDLTFSSSPGEGTCFRASFPLTDKNP